jgi:thioester reductase-like protein
VTFRPVSAATLERLAGGQPAATPAPDLAQIRAAAPARRRELVLAHMRGLVAQVLGARPQDVDPQEAVSAYADSLMLAELRERLVTDLGVTLPLEAFFDETLTALAKLIADKLPGGRGGRTPGSQLRVMTVEQLHEQATLDPEITASGPPAAGPDAVLLTGATGFVGAFLLSELLRRRQGEVICLVRAQDETHAMRRVLQNLGSYGLDAGADAGRIVAVPGDLARPLLGLDERSCAALHDRVGSIYHCGAVVKWTYPYAGLEPANVGGTREVLRLATRGASRPVHFVSTVGVFSSAQSTSAVARETDELSGSGPLAVGYAQSKWVAEQLVRTAAVTIHRVNTAGHAVTGAFNRLDHLSMMVKGCIEAGIAPLDAPMPVQPAPVDYVARAMVELAGRPELAGQTFHLVNDQPLGWPEFFDAVEGFGYPLERLPFADWRARIVSRTSGTMALLGLVPFLSDAVDQVRLPVSDSALTRRALAGTGISCPPLTAGLVRTYLRAFVSRGFVDPPARVPAESCPAES